MANELAATPTVAENELEGDEWPFSRSEILQFAADCGGDERA